MNTETGSRTDDELLDPKLLHRVDRGVSGCLRGNSLISSHPAHPLSLEGMR